MTRNSLLSSKLHLALIAGATAVFAAAPAAEAAVIYTDLTATPLVIPNNLDGVYLNILTGATGTSGLDVAGWDINPYNNGGGLTFYGSASPAGILATGTPGTSAQATALALGALISAAGQYNQFQTRGAAFQVTGQEFLGFRFLNENTNAINYGWALISTTASSGVNLGFPASILGYAYEDTGASIAAGAGLPAVPEPSTYAMFGLALAAAAGRTLWKRRAD
jgi:hypothetical protein